MIRQVRHPAGPEQGDAGREPGDLMRRRSCSETSSGLAVQIAAWLGPVRRMARKFRRGNAAIRVLRKHSWPLIFRSLAPIYQKERIDRRFLRLCRSMRLRTLHL